MSTLAAVQPLLCRVTLKTWQAIHISQGISKFYVHTLVSDPFFFFTFFLLLSKPRATESILSTTTVVQCFLAQNLWPAAPSFNNKAQSWTVHKEGWEHSACAGICMCTCTAIFRRTPTRIQGVCLTFLKHKNRGKSLGDPFGTARRAGHPIHHCEPPDGGNNNKTKQKEIKHEWLQITLWRCYMVKEVELLESAPSQVPGKPVWIH